jgi:hypothetical protein
MSDTILSGKLTVYYLDENRRKQIRWTGTTAKSDTQKMIDVYDATEDLMTQPDQLNDGLIFSGETPGEYTIGKIDAGEIEPWFIDMKTMEHIVGDFANFTGCALKTSGWKRDLPGDGTGNTGIVVVPVASGHTIVVGDIGQDISHADGDDGTLLDVIITGGSTDYLWIRPDTNTLADDWNSTTGTITEAGSSHTATQSAAAITGEMVWGNFYTQGALVSDTHVYVLQDGSRVTSSDETDQDWWTDGHVDRAIPITDYTTADFPIIDDGYLTVKANQYGSKYTYAIIRMNSTSGGNVSAGLSSGDDITNTTGYASITTTAVATDDFSVGDEIEGSDATTPARAIITQIDGTSPTYTFHYFLIGDPLVDFTSAAETITNNDGTGSATKNTSAPADQGPALASWFDGSAVPTYAFANAQADIDDDGTDEEYGITIDMNSCSLSQMHEYNKYVHMRSATTVDQDGLDGEQWIGLDYAINYASITGTVAEGSVVTGATSGATGTVVSNPAGTSNTALLRNSRGTFVDGERIYETDGVNEFDATGLTVEVIVPVAANSFGTLAGANFFATRGVLLTEYKSSEENLFSLIDATGEARARPTSITMEILNLKQHDYATCFRLTGSGGSIDKTEYSATGGEAAGDTTLTVDTAIAADVPGKTVGGTLYLVDASDNYQEYVIRFSSYAAATGVVTLANIDIAAATSGSTTTVGETGAFSTAKVGDLVYNHDLAEVVYVTEVNSNDLITVHPPFSGDPTGNHIELNCVPITLVDTADQVFFTIIFEFKTADGTASASMQYIAPIYSRVVVRNTADATTKIKGFTQDVTISSSGGTSSATRIENTVYGS